MPIEGNLPPEGRACSAKWYSPALKISAIALLLILPIAFLSVILKPILMAQRHYARTYPLPALFSREELVRFLTQLSSEKEFKFYFSVFPEEGFRQAIRDIYPLLKMYPDKASLRPFVLKVQANVEQMAREVKALDDPPQFSANPMNYPQLVYASWNFMYEEFKATLMAVVYQTLYDHSFIFLWNNDAREAAYLVRRRVESLDVQQRAKCEQLFLKVLQLRPVSQKP
jgi:hypothetical protein